MCVLITQHISIITADQYLKHRLVFWTNLLWFFYGFVGFMFVLSYIVSILAFLSSFRHALLTMNNLSKSTSTVTYSHISVNINKKKYSMCYF